MSLKVGSGKRSKLELGNILMFNFLYRKISKVGSMRLQWGSGELRYETGAVATVYNSNIIAKVIFYTIP